MENFQLGCPLFRMLATLDREFPVIHTPSNNDFGVEPKKLVMFIVLTTISVKYCLHQTTYGCAWLQEQYHPDDQTESGRYATRRDQVCFDAGFRTSCSYRTC